jgi:hypothetical protein
MKLYSILPLIITFLPIEEALGSGLRAEVDGRDDPLFLDNDSLDVAFDNDPELDVLDPNPELMSTSFTLNDHRELVQCPPGCKPDSGPAFQGSFTRGPYCVPWGHKQSTVVVGGMCHNGCKRVRAVVTSVNKDRVACGSFNARNHDAPAAVWYSPNNPSDCRLNIPYCEHYCASSSCTWKIYENCN